MNYKSCPTVVRVCEQKRSFAATISSCSRADSVCCSYPEKEGNEMCFYGFLLLLMLFILFENSQGRLFHEHLRINAYLASVSAACYQQSVSHIISASRWGVESLFKVKRQMRLKIKFISVNFALGSATISKNLIGKGNAVFRCVTSDVQCANFSCIFD